MNKYVFDYLSSFSLLSLATVSAGFIGYLHEKRKTEKAKRESFQTFKEVYEDNAPHDDKREDDELDSVERAFKTVRSFLDKRTLERAKQANIEDNAPREDDELDSIERAFNNWY